MRKIYSILVGLFIVFGSLAQESKPDLKTRFDVIRNETVAGANTKTRIANAYQELADGTLGIYPVSASGTDTYTGSLQGLDAYSGRIVFVSFANNNTGAATLNINAIGAGNIHKYDGGWTALDVGDIIAGKLYRLYHDGTRFQIDLGGAGGSVEWGVITGTLSDQTDLQTALDLKVPTSRTISTTSPLSGGGDLSANRTISIANAAADGTTKGAASFIANDFDASSGNIGIDYTNGQASSGSTKGFLTSADWTTFNNKQATGLSYLLASGGTASGPNTYNGSTTNIFKYVFNGIGITSTDGAGHWLANTTAATSGNQQQSPSTTYEGQGWKTNATAASQSVKYLVDLLPIQGAAAPTGNLRWRSSVNGAAYGTQMFLSTGGLLGIPSTGAVIFGASAITANTRLEVIGTGTTTNLIYRFADSGSTLRTSLADNGVLTHTGKYNLTGTALGGASLSDNFLNVTGTLPSSMTQTTAAVSLLISGASASSQNSMALRVDYSGGYTGSSGSIGGVFINRNAGTNAVAPTTSTLIGNIGGGGFSEGNTNTGHNYGLYGEAQLGILNVGTYGHAQTEKNSGTNIGGAFQARNTGSSPNEIGVYVGLESSATALPTNRSAGLIVNNGSTTRDVARFEDNGTSVMSIVDGGGVLIGGTSITTSALLDLQSTTRALILPRMTKAQRDAIATPSAGMVIYQTDNTPGLRVYNGTNWMRFTETSD